MTGEEKMPKPMETPELSFAEEELSLRKPFHHSVHDFVKTYSSFGERAWLKNFPAEAKIDFGHISNDNDIMPQLELATEVDIPFVKVKVEGILQFSDIAVKSGLPESKGIESYIGLSAARSFIAFAREYKYLETKHSTAEGRQEVTRTSVFNEELLNGFDARASLDSVVTNSRFKRTLLEGLTLRLMSDTTVTNLQTYRAMFGLMYLSHGTKYLEMMTAFETHFTEEVVDQERHRQKMERFVAAGQLDQKVYDRWLVDSFTDVWFAAVHPFDEEEVKALLG